MWIDDVTYEYTQKEVDSLAYSWKRLRRAGWGGTRGWKECLEKAADWQMACKELGLNPHRTTKDERVMVCNYLNGKRGNN